MKRIKSRHELRHVTSPYVGVYDVTHDTSGSSAGVFCGYAVQCVVDVLLTGGDACNETRLM